MRRPLPGQSAVTAAGQARPADIERATLDKAAAENFPVAPFFLPRAWRHDLMAVYGFARLVDDIGDGDLAPAAPTPAPSASPTTRPATASPCWTPWKPIFAGCSTRRDRAPVTPSCSAWSPRSAAVR